MKARTKMILMLGASAVVFGGVFGFTMFRDKMIKQYFATMPKPVMAVTADQVREENWSSTVAAVGSLKAVNGVDVSAQVAGQVREIRFQSGQKVKKGDLLVRLDAEVEASEMRSAQAERELAAAQERRSRTLASSNFASQAALDKAEADLKVKEAKVAQLAAQVAKKSIHAPFDGVVGLRKIDVGQYLQPGQAIVNLQDLSTLLVQLSVSQKEVAGLAAGLAIRAIVDAWPGRAFDGVITAIEPEIDAKSGMAILEAKIPNPDEALRPGMFAKVEIGLAGERSVLTVPVQAVSYNLHGDTLFVIREGKDNKTVERLAVELGERRDGRIAAKGELKKGDLVVTAGQLKLETGSLVTLAAEDPLKPALQAARGGDSQAEAKP
jgi:membrane fusion protein (multidrug efflux system)